MIDDRLELVKSQCGRHSLSELAKLIHISKTTLKSKIDQLEIKFPKSPFGAPCHFCTLKNNTVKEN